MSNDPILDPLNAAQREAVTSPSLATLVLAGAGSGKTRVLTHRMAWLVAEQGISPYSLLAVTFTNKAAGEMRGRLGSLLDGQELGPRGVDGMWVGTFHGLCHRLLRQHAREAGLPEGFQIIDADDQLRLVKRLIREAELDENRFPPRLVASMINGFKEDGLRARHVVPGDDPIRDQVIVIYKAYERVCERSGLVDFTELLLRATELLRGNDALRAHYQRRFRQILIDEFQDTNALQYAWARLLVGEGNGIFAVGDDDQSIYGWRGAKVEHIQHFSRDFPNTHVVRLEQNYRSTRTILEAANSVIARNQGRLGKNLWTEGESGAPIRFYRAFNDQDEANFVVEQIAAAVREGHARSDCAVLYRSNAQSRLLEEALIREGMPYRIYGGLRFFERAEIRDALAYLKLVANRHDDTSFDRIVNRPTRGIGDKTLNEVRQAAREQGASLWDAALILLAENRLSPRAAGALRQFMTLIEAIDQQTINDELGERIEKTIEKSGLRALFEKDRDRERGEAKIENLDELVSAGRGFVMERNTDEEMSEIEAFLAHASLEAGEAQGAAWEDCVQMMTLHAAKGLEFPQVFLVGVEEGLFPHQMSIDEPGRLEEERRLCYVGITRAEQQLTITCAESRRLHGKQIFPMPSRFLGELPPELVEEVRPRATRAADAFGPRRREGEPAPRTHKQNETGFEIGQNVRHAKFGEGTILDCEGAGGTARVQVNFGQHGTKWLILSYANLQPA